MLASVCIFIPPANVHSPAGSGGVQGAPRHLAHQRCTPSWHPSAHALRAAGWKRDRAARTWPLPPQARLLRWKRAGLGHGGQKGALRRVLPADGSGVPAADHVRAAHGGHRPAARRENPTARSSFAAGIPLFTRLSTRWRGATPHGRRHDDPRLLSRKKPRRLFPSTVTNSDSDVALEALRIYSNGRGRDWQRVLESRAFAGWRKSCGLILEAVM